MTACEGSFLAVTDKSGVWRKSPDRCGRFWTVGYDGDLSRTILDCGIHYQIETGNAD
ncbi:hypothetical protein DPMN_189418 [Dreissena polymorpha]|uniref:Uncharacterized protein n=1 Tax=Dreissena polymorpha TaxID=45954 RepID=A0A9D4IC69_DREPO|nr:hypothetical protein DPMN_189418 [Dreissena polymorpha]